MVSYNSINSTLRLSVAHCYLHLSVEHCYQYLCLAHCYLCYSLQCYMNLSVAVLPVPFRFPQLPVSIRCTVLPVSICCKADPASIRCKVVPASIRCKVVPASIRLRLFFLISSAESVLVQESVSSCAKLGSLMFVREGMGGFLRYKGAMFVTGMV